MAVGEVRFERVEKGGFCRCCCYRDFEVGVRRGAKLMTTTTTTTEKRHKTAQTYDKAVTPFSSNRPDSKHSR